MIKRAIPLFVAAGLVSVLLLFIGTAVMNRISPVFASQLPALIAGQSGKGSVSVLLPTENKNSEPSQNVMTSTPEAIEYLSETTPLSKTPSTAPGAQPTPSPTMPPGPTINNTIAELLANPASYLNRVVTINGRVTVLSSHKFLINDGTGQIIIDLTDRVKVTLTNGTTLTVVGVFDRIDSRSGFYINASTLVGIGGTTIASTCDDLDDDDDDDLDDDCDNDSDDDPDDDLDDDTDDNDTDDDDDNNDDDDADDDTDDTADDDDDGSDDDQDD